MRKAERLFQILTLLRSRRGVLTAEEISQELEVSERTIYRDMQALLLSGVPIEAEAGVGYRLMPGFNLPPLMFDEDELEALRLGIRMVEGWSGSAMIQAAQRALQKIEAVLPEKAHWTHTHGTEKIVVPDFHRESASPFSDEIHHSIKHQYTLALNYISEANESSERTVWPLGMIYWGRTWTLVAWCELRKDYRLFRLDRIQNLTVNTSTFTTTETINLRHYLMQQEETTD